MDKISKPYIAPVEGYVHENCVTSCCCILYEFIHKQKMRRAHVSKFVHIYIDFRYAGVPTDWATGKIIDVYISTLSTETDNKCMAQFLSQHCQHGKDDKGGRSD